MAEFRTLFAVMLLGLISFLLGQANAGYDYSATTECHDLPWKAAYNGGLVTNPDIDNGFTGWDSFGYAKIEVKELGKNTFLCATNRSEIFSSPSQTIHVQGSFLYTFSAWVQIDGNGDSTAVIYAKVAIESSSKGSSTVRYMNVASAKAFRGCWTLIKGGFELNNNGDSMPYWAGGDATATLYFESDDKSCDIWVDGVSIQPFTPRQWNHHQRSFVKEARRGRMTVRLTNSTGHAIGGAKVEVRQKTASFPFGCALTSEVLRNRGYQEWFKKRFNVATFVNEMKWYSTESEQGKVSYETADAMLDFCNANNIKVRGHNIVWEDPHYVQPWIKALPWHAVKQALWQRIESVVKHYKGKLIAWDVVNEPLHFSYYDDVLGRHTTNDIYDRVRSLDPNTTLFVNEFNTVENIYDGSSVIESLLAKVKQIQEPGMKIGIGLESHFNSFPINRPLVRAILDKVGSAGLPVWITEVDVADASISKEQQAVYLEQVLREAYSHPSVQGIVMWFSYPVGYPPDTRLLDPHFHNTPAGDAVDKLVHRWNKAASKDLLTDKNGIFSFTGSLGDFEIVVRSNLYEDAIFTLQINDTGMQPPPYSIHV